MSLRDRSFSSGGVLDAIKSKIGFQGSASYDDELYDDEAYDDYAPDYGEYAYDENEYYEDDGSTTSATSRAYGQQTAPISSRPAGYSSARPHLVSIDDVRARTQVPQSLQRDPLPPRHVTTAAQGVRKPFYGNRTVVDGRIPSTADSIAEAQAISAQGSASRERSESLDGLFTSTAAPAASAVPSASAAASSASASPSAPTGGKAATSYDPYEAYAGSGAPLHTPSRSVKVLKPISYGEVEQVAKSLKAGDAVVLALRNTPEPLVKRLLDFSFGVASALDASVDCIADKVFVLVRGSGLSDAEKAGLRNQGVI